ncbi:RNA polymerase sigma factor [Lentzea sp. E54]|uniref:RNA polymerase sigma factor n=1 Tax=Lentzea xerophila TaxID=3435883 RepID=UPI003DA1CC38
MGDEVSVLVRDCRRGRQQAWRSVVEEFTPVVWTVAKSFGLPAGDCEDVCQSTWIQVFTGIDSIRRPERLRTWIVTVAKRESIKHLQFSAHHVLVPDLGCDVREPCGSGPEEVAVARADHRRVRAALLQLPGHHQALVRLLIRDPAPTYDEISARLNIPRGSIGPTRNRIMHRLRELLEQDQDLPPVHHQQTA